MWSGNLVPGSGFAFIINWGHSLIGGADYNHSTNTYLTMVFAMGIDMAETWFQMVG